MQRDEQIFDLILDEQDRQIHGIELIASENFVSDQVMEAAGSCLTNKYAEGYPGKRYYGGCEVVDIVEQIAIDRAKALFGAEYVNVQPHSGSQANTAVFAACLKPGDTILGFDLSHGGHLTHGSPVNFSGKLYRPVFYGVEEETGVLNYDKIQEIALREKPKMIIAGASAYSRDMDFKRFREIADSVGAKAAEGVGGMGPIDRLRVERARSDVPGMEAGGGENEDVAFAVTTLEGLHDFLPGAVRDAGAVVGAGAFACAAVG